MSAYHRRTIVHYDQRNDHSGRRNDHYHRRTIVHYDRRNADTGGDRTTGHAVRRNDHYDHSGRRNDHHNGYYGGVL